MQRAGCYGKFRSVFRLLFLAPFRAFPPPPPPPSRLHQVLSEVEQKQLLEQKDAAPETRLKMDDADYEIRVEAYDPTVLKHHVLHILDEHIRQCLRDHPHLYTLGCVAGRCCWMGRCFLHRRQRHFKKCSHLCWPASAICIACKLG